MTYTVSGLLEPAKLLIQSCCKLIWSAPACEVLGSHVPLRGDQSRHAVSLIEMIGNKLLYNVWIHASFPGKVGIQAACSVSWVVYLLACLPCCLSYCTWPSVNIFLSQGPAYLLLVEHKSLAKCR